MKRTLLFMAIAFFTAIVSAQLPEKMSYQAIIRNSSDNLLTNTQIGMQITILQGTADGSAVYTETQSPTTNANGLVSIEIGSGTSSDDFSAIDWTNGPYFIKTETDPEGGTNYTITGTSQLLSVPYALHAKTAESVTGAITETDPVFTGSVASGITPQDTAAWNAASVGSYLETDPVYGASQASNITASDIANLGKLSGTNTGDQDLSSLATKSALADSAAQVRSEIPNVSGFLTSETDPVYAASQASNITASDIANLDNLSGTNTGDQDLSSLATKSALTDSSAQLRSEIPDVSGFLTSEVDGSITNEIELPDQSGNSGKYLTTNGSTPSWATITTGASQLSELSDVNTSTATSGNILVANGTKFESVAISGDATLASNGALTIADNSVDGTDIALGSDATGDVMYYNGTDWIRLAKGSDGQVLTLSGGIPTWATPSGGGGGGINSDESGLKIIRGTVDFDGTILQGSGFTVTKNGTGDYTINFSSAFSGTPTAVATPIDVDLTGMIDIVYVHSMSTSSFDVIMGDWSSVDYYDLAFTFIAIGPE